MSNPLQPTIGSDLPRQSPFLIGLSKINVLLGRNGCGKSTLLRKIDAHYQNNPAEGRAKYITPERGGNLTYDGNIETNISNNSAWLPSVRRSNRSDNFRQVSAGEFRRLETLVLREIEKNAEIRASLFNFDDVMISINSLLDNVQIERAEEAGFQVKNKGDANYRSDLTSLSSGESELISLSIEILSYCYQIRRRAVERDIDDLILLDEPDVHLHPDLQERLVNLLYKATLDIPVTVIIATHSTTILSSIAKLADKKATVAFMSIDVNHANFRPISEIMKSVLPVFGAHPLSNVFLEKPLLLVEGEDDERVWQQAVRSSMGQISVWPCAAGDIQSLSEHEDTVEEIAKAIYDRPIAYSLRDRDEDPYEISDKPIVKRMRLNCRAAENLLLSDNVLNDLGTDWGAMKEAMEQWLDNNPNHRQAPDMRSFRDGGYDRRNASIKSLRNLIMERAGSQKPWEVAVGQSIAKLRRSNVVATENDLANYLGEKAVKLLLK